MTYLSTIGRKTLKVFAWIAGIYLLVLLAAGIYINSQKEKIMQYVSNELQDKLRGKVIIEDIDVTVWRHFPHIAFRMHGFSLTDSVYHKPVLAAKKIYTTFNPFRLLGSNKSVNNIIIKEGRFHLFTDSNGYSNKYLLQPQEKNTAEKKQGQGQAVTIEDVTIKNFMVMIEDKAANKEISMQVNELSAIIKDKGKTMNIEMEEDITMKKGLGFNLARGAYLEGQTLEGDWMLTIDKAARALSFDKTTVEINGHPFALHGRFVFDKGNPNFAVYLDTKELPYENANKIVTAAIRSKTGLVQMKEPLDVQGSVVGSLLPAREPAVDISWQTQGNTLTTQVVGFTHCSFSGNFNNSVHKDSLHNDQNSAITFSSFEGNWDGVNLTGKDITIINLDSPRLHFTLHSDCKLEALDNKFALKDIHFKGGETSLDLFYDGPLTNDNSMLQDLEGKLLMKNGVIEYVPRSFTFTDCYGDIGFFKDSISMRKFSCSYLKNKLDIQVDGRNIRRKFLANDMSQEALINCRVTSPYINLEDFNALFAPVKQRKRNAPPPSFAATARKLDETLVNSIIAVDIRARDVRHQQMQASNFEAQIKFHPHHWEVAKIAINLAGGTIFAKGTLQHQGNGNHNADIAAQVTNVDVQKLLYAFENFKQDAITDKHLRGNFSSTAAVKAGINRQGKIVPSSMNGIIDFSLKNGSLKHFPPFENMKRFVFKNRDMSDVRFAELKDKMEIRGTDIFINRMEIQSSVCRLFVQGNYGLRGKNTDLLIQIPLSNLNDKNFEDGKAPKNKGTTAKTGMSVWLRAVNDDEGKVKMKLTLRKKLKDDKKNEKLQKSLEAEKK